MKTFQQFTQDLHEKSRFVSYLLGQSAKQAAKAGIKVPKNYKQVTTNMLRGAMGVADETSKGLEKYAGKFVSGARQTDNAKFYQNIKKGITDPLGTPNMDKTLRKMGRLKPNDPLIQAAPTSKKISPAAANQEGLFRDKVKKFADKLKPDDIVMDTPATARHEAQRGMSKAKIRKAEKDANSPLGKLFDIATDGNTKHPKKLERLHNIRPQSNEIQFSNLPVDGMSRTMKNTSYGRRTYSHPVPGTTPPPKNSPQLSVQNLNPGGTPEDGIYSSSVVKSAIKKTRRNLKK